MIKKTLFIIIFSLSVITGIAQVTQGTVITGPLVTTDSLDDYYTHSDYFGLTSYKIVKNLAQMYAIPRSRRIVGMKVFVQSIENTYKLLDCIENNCFVEDRIDTLKYGTFSTGKITIQSKLDPGMLFDIYNQDGYQRFGVARSGLLLAGRRMPLMTNVDALAYIGDRNDLNGTDGMAIGKDIIADGDTSAGLGYNLRSSQYNSMTIGRGKSRSNRLNSKRSYSVNIGAFQDTAQIELTKDTIRLNSKVLWHNGVQLGGSGTPVDGLLHWDGTAYNPYTSISGNGLILSNSSTVSNQNATGYLNVNGQLIVGSSHTSNNRPAIYGGSYSNTGVTGFSQTYVGVAGNSTSGIGIVGNSSSGTAVQGTSVSGSGVFGYSFTGVGVKGNIYGGSISNIFEAWYDNTTLKASISYQGVLSSVHLKGISSSPSIIAYDAGAGTGAIISISGNDMAGTITLIRGANAVFGNSLICTVTFNVPYSSPPIVIIRPSNGITAANAGSKDVYVDQPSVTNNSFDLITNSTVALPAYAGTPLKWNYLVIQ